MQTPADADNLKASYGTLQAVEAARMCQGVSCCAAFGSAGLWGKSGSCTTSWSLGPVAQCLFSSLGWGDAASSTTLYRTIFLKKSISEVTETVPSNAKPKPRLGTVCHGPNLWYGTTCRTGRFGQVSVCKSVTEAQSLHLAPQGVKHCETTVNRFCETVNFWKLQSLFVMIVMWRVGWRWSALVILHFKAHCHYRILWSVWDCMQLSPKARPFAAGDPGYFGRRVY